MSDLSLIVNQELMVGVTDISACEKQSHAFWRMAETMINKFCGRHLGPQFILDLDHCFCCSDVFSLQE